MSESEPSGQRTFLGTRSAVDVPIECAAAPRRNLAELAWKIDDTVIPFSALEMLGRVPIM